MPLPEHLRNDISPEFYANNLLYDLGVKPLYCPPLSRHVLKNLS